MSEEALLVEERLGKLLTQHHPSVTSSTEFWGAQFDLGLAWVQFPEGQGGLGVSPQYQRTVDERLESEGASFVNKAENVLGYGMGAPTVVTHGTEEQGRRWLRPLFTSEEIWCQLFSEPGAGSDVAGLSTRAERDGDEWVINGQKVWTTLAQTARWGMLIARTDPDVPKHQGITYFVVDMHQPGVEVRGLRQITGESEFNEVYFTDARVPDADRLGEVGDGWRVALTTLMNERVAIGSGVPPRNAGAIGEAMRIWKEGGHASRPRRDRLMRLWCESEAARLTNLRAAQSRSRGVPGPEGSTAKIQWAELNKQIYELCVDLLGPEGMLYPPAYGQDQKVTVSNPQRNFLRSRANSIEGGTTEILKNVLGERVLGLPGEPRVDKDLPWKQVPR
jgi:alkylation response protein AidB-like acyl-CoA dehydrogenase